MNAFDAIDRLAELAACYRAVEQLTIPNMDTSVIDRDDLAALLLVLNRLNEEALRALQQALK